MVRHSLGDAFLRDPISATFAKRLKEARALSGLSQRALGGLVTGDKANGGVRINRYEQGVNRADMDTAAALAKELNVPLAFLFSEDDLEAEMLLAFAKLRGEDRAKALSLVRQAAGIGSEAEADIPKSPSSAPPQS